MDFGGEGEKTGYWITWAFFNYKKLFVCFFLGRGTKKKDGVDDEYQKQSQLTVLTSIITFTQTNDQHMGKYIL